MVLDRSSQCLCEEAQVVLLLVKKPKMVCFWCLRRAEISQSELKERFTFQVVVFFRFEYIIVKHIIINRYNTTWEESECTTFSADSFIDMDTFDWTCLSHYKWPETTLGLISEDEKNIWIIFHGGPKEMFHSADSMSVMKGSTLSIKMKTASVAKMCSRRADFVRLEAHNSVFVFEMAGQL